MDAPKRSWWLIKISGYGNFAYWATYTEAADMASGKAQWEGGKGEFEPCSTVTRPKEIRDEVKRIKCDQSLGIFLSTRELDCLEKNK